MQLLAIYLIGLIICTAAFLLLCYFKPDTISDLGLDIAGVNILSTFFVILLLLVYPFLLTVILLLYLIGKGMKKLMDKGEKRQATIRRKKGFERELSKYY